MWPHGTSTWVLQRSMQTLHSPPGGGGAPGAGAAAAAEPRLAWEALRERLASAWASTTVDAHSCDSCCARRAASPSLSLSLSLSASSLSCVSLPDTALVRSCM